jgi:hypothetical protein
MDQTPTPESEVKVNHFAIQTEHAAKEKLGRQRSLKKRKAMLVWNPKVENLMRGLLSRWIEVR